MITSLSLPSRAGLLCYCIVVVVAVILSVPMAPLVVHALKLNVVPLRRRTYRLSHPVFSVATALNTA
jgi:hypothetical protein